MRFEEKKQKKSDNQVVQTIRSNEMQSSSPDSVKDAFLHQSDQNIKPMQLRHRRLLGITDDESATFGAGGKPSKSQIMQKQLLNSALKGGLKCQVYRDCPNASVG